MGFIKNEHKEKLFKFTGDFSPKAAKADQKLKIPLAINIKHEKGVVKP